MATFRFHIAEKPPNLRRRSVDSLRFTVLWVMGMLVIERFSHGHWDRPIAWIIGGATCFLGGLLTSFLWPPKPQSLDFKIDDFGIRSSWNDRPLHKVRSDRVHYVAERRGIFGTRLLVSEERSLLKRLFSARRVSIPRRLVQAEEYEQIKAMAMAWLHSVEQ
jgi:hypothetical protein